MMMPPTSPLEPHLNLILNLIEMPHNWSYRFGIALAKIAWRIKPLRPYLLREALIREATIKPDEHDDGFIAECTIFPGAMGQGATKREALNNLCDAIWSLGTADHA